MNILFISTKGPLPTNDGHSLRTFNLLKQISIEHNVYLLSFVKFSDELEYITDVQEICLDVKYFDLLTNKSKILLLLSIIVNLFSSKPFVAQKYKSRSMSNAIKDVLKRKKIDIVFLDMLPLCCYIDLLKGHKVFLNEHNVESELLKRQVNNEKKLFVKKYFTLQQKRLEKFEKESISQVDHIFSCSDTDARLLKRMSKTNVTVIPNGVDTLYFSSKGKHPEDDNNIVFVGGMNWFPNFDAIKWFNDDILPLVLKKKPDIVINIIGDNSKVPSGLNSHNIVFHGRVEDIRPYVERASVFIVPLKIGGGTRLKILDAMSMGKAIVSTSIGAEGLSTTDEENILIADTPEAFSHKIIDAIYDIKKRNSLKENARRFVLDNYQWEKIGQKVMTTFAAVNTQTTDEKLL